MTTPILAKLRGLLDDLAESTFGFTSTYPDEAVPTMNCDYIKMELRENYGEDTMSLVEHLANIAGIEGCEDIVEIGLKRAAEFGAAWRTTAEHAEYERMRPVRDRARAIRAAYVLSDGKLRALCKQSVADWCGSIAQWQALAKLEGYRFMYAVDNMVEFVRVNSKEFYRESDDTAKTAR